MPRALTSNADPLDHAAEFADRVARETPGEYDRLMKTARVRQLLATENPINPGKIYTWAEYRVFRQEFRHRFPDARRRACINAFCRLFLKNDISVSNLLQAIEPVPDEDLALLEKRSGGEKKPTG